jgi:hypothetical protein
MVKKIRHLLLHTAGWGVLVAIARNSGIVACPGDPFRV